MSLTQKYNSIYVLNSYVIVGEVEGKGPLKDYFNEKLKNNYYNEKTFEKAEQKLMKNSINQLLVESSISINEIDLIISGDLLNQNSTTNYTLKNFDVPVIGIYGACSTSMQSIILASNFLKNNMKNIICTTASHNNTAEKQYRYPNEYGAYKPDTSTYTVTAGATCLVSKVPSKIKIKSSTIGRIIDFDFKDPNNMGAAMAPAAFNTIKDHLKNLNVNIEYYDAIYTGDLSNIGNKILNDMLEDHYGKPITNLYDCGLTIFDINKQKVFSGGSGTACCPSVTYTYIFKKLLDKTYNRVLVVATGALHNPEMLMQKESIPCIANAVEFERVSE